MKIKKNKLAWVLLGSTVVLAGCVGNSSGTTTNSAANKTVNVITLANNPYIESGSRQMLSSSSSDITPPSSVVTAHPKIKGSDEEAYLGIPILNNTGSTINGFYIHNWDRTGGNYINGNGMTWESGIEIAHTMLNNKYNDWYFPIGITEANVNDSNISWNAYGYLGGHTSSTDSWNPSTEWTIELSIGGKCYYTQTSRSEAHSDENLVDTINGWSGSTTNAWSGTGEAPTNAWAAVAQAVTQILHTLFDPTFGITGGLWSEFTPDGNGGYNWNIHSGAGFAQQDANGNWSAILKAVPDSAGNASFDLTPDTQQSDCNSINDRLPSNHPAGKPPMPGGPWSYNGCVEQNWDGTTLTAQCLATVATGEQLEYTSQIDTKICANPNDISPSPNGADLMCSPENSPSSSAYYANPYNGNIQTLVNSNGSNVYTNPFLLSISMPMNRCYILSVTDNLASQSESSGGITSITAQCYTQSLTTSQITGPTVVTSTIDPQSCRTSSGYNIVNLNGSLACGGGSGSGVTLTGANTFGAILAYYNESVVTAAVPVTDSSTLTKILANMPNWIDTELNAVNNVSFINYPQVCSDGYIQFDQNTQNLQCEHYRSDISAIMNANANVHGDLFDLYGATTTNSCNIIGAARDESGNLLNIEYNCSYGTGNLSSTGFFSKIGFINPQLCQNNVMVESATDGTLSCAYSAPPVSISGNWSQLCTQSSYVNGVLSASCNSPTGTNVTSTLNYTHVCAANSTVSDINGYLSCDSYGSWWNVSLDGGSPPSWNDSWLAADNSSCIIQDVTQSGDYYNISSACQYNGGYSVASSLISSCPHNLTNSYGLLGCS